MPAMIERAILAAIGNGGKQRRNSGKFGASHRFMPLSFHKESNMNHPLFASGTRVADDPVARLDAMIADARSAAIAADAEVAAISAEIAAIEPHPHAHGYTAAGDCGYSSMTPQHFLPLAGLLAQPWSATLATVETIRQEQGFDYLLKAFPSAFEALGDALVNGGARLIDDRAECVDDDLTVLFARKPMLALGMVWRLFGFHRRDGDAWVGIFAYDADLLTLIGSTERITATTMFGDALAMTVATHRIELSAAGIRELHKRSARRDAERQASWAEVSENYRLRGSWRGRTMTKGQRHMMHRIEAARGLPMPIATRRGASSDAIADAGGNPRFCSSGEENA